MNLGQVPQPTTDLDLAKSHMTQYGYCVILDAISASTALKCRDRLLEQLQAEEELGIQHLLPDRKQLVYFLANKGQVFLDLAVHDSLNAIVGHVLGERFLLSSISGHIAHPGGGRVLHTDQWWMPPPISPQEQPQLRPGSYSRERNRGALGSRKAGAQFMSISQPVVCNSMWMLEDFTAENGATNFVPGSHLFGREPDEKDEDANWVPAMAPAGSLVVFEGRTWHTTGINRTETMRVGVNTNFCAPQFRQQENFQLGVFPEILEGASTRLLELFGFNPWEGYGSIEYLNDWVARDRYTVGELKPQSSCDP